MGKKLVQGLFTLAFVGYFIYQNFFQFGSKLEFGSGQEVYYKSGATETDARRVGEALKTLGYFGASDEASVQVIKSNDDYVVRFVVNEVAWTDPEYKEGFAYVGYSLQELAFPGKTMHVELCDTSFDTQLKVEPKAPPLEETIDTTQEAPTPEAEPAQTP